jgi:glucokinase
LTQHIAFLAIDIGGTNTNYGFVLTDGTILFKRILESGNSHDPGELIGRIVLNVNNDFKSFSNKYYLHGIGVGAPNVNYKNRTVDNPVNLNWKGSIPISDMLEKMFSIPVQLINDANAGALGELYYGGAKKMKDFVFITLGTGLGSGIISNGKLVSGHHGLAGELGHVTIIENGRLCGCGRKGCLEQYCSATGLVETYKELSGIESLEKYEATEISKKAKNNDEIARKAFYITGDLLGRSLANTVAHLDPEAIFLFGGLIEAGNLLLNPLQKSFQENLFPPYKNKTKILISSVPGKDAAILGAASAIMDFLKSNEKY